MALSLGVYVTTWLNYTLNCGFLQRWTPHWGALGGLWQLSGDLLGEPRRSRL